MDLLFESKRIWLLSYLICTIIFGFLFIFFWDNSIARTIGILFLEVQLIVLVFFLIILIFKWTNFCRCFSSGLYLGLTIYEGVNGNLCKWYVIVPVFLVTEFYMIWNLGGVINCVDMSPYRKILNQLVTEGKKSYDSNVRGLDDFNSRNGTRVRKKGEPNWKKLGFGYSSTEMFYPVKALIGIKEIDSIKNLGVDKKERKLKKFNENLDDKNVVLDSNRILHEEKEKLDTVVSKGNEAGVDTSGLNKSAEDLDEIIKENVKACRIILKRK